MDDYRRALREIFGHYVVRLRGLPGHCYITGNEMVDEFARLGSEMGDTNCVKTVRPSIGFYSAKIREWVLNFTYGNGDYIHRDFFCLCFMTLQFSYGQFRESFSQYFLNGGLLHLAKHCSSYITIKYDF